MLGILEYIHRYYNANYMPFLLNLVRKIGFYYGGDLNQDEDL